jgi:hypothetical protein
VRPEPNHSVQLFGICALSVMVAVLSWSLWKAVQTGTFQTRYSWQRPCRRAQQPIFYWLIVFLHAVALLAFATVLLGIAAK